jgi:hypothetical protein
MPLSIVPKDMRGADYASFTEVEHYSRGGTGHSLDTLTKHEGYLSEIYSQGADDIMSAAKTASQEKVLGAIKRTGQKWEVSVGEREQRAPVCAHPPTRPLREFSPEVTSTRSRAHPPAHACSENCPPPTLNFANCRQRCRKGKSWTRFHDKNAKPA